MSALGRFVTRRLRPIADVCVAQHRTSVEIPVQARPANALPATPNSWLSADQEIAFVEFAFQLQALRARISGQAFLPPQLPERESEDLSVWWAPP